MKTLPLSSPCNYLAFAAAALVALAPAATAKDAPDFKKYNQPVYQQIVERIQAKVAARLGGEKLTRDRYFIIPFAYENRGNDPEFSHSFMTVIRVFAQGSPARGAAEFHTGTYKGWRFEAYNISWIPYDFAENPHLCVFNGFGARIVPSWNKCPVSVGKNFSLEETIKIAVGAKVAIAMWGPYEVSKAAFDLGVKRKHLLDSGKIKYRADDRIQREQKVACNCFHAMASLDDLFPNGGFLNTGFKMGGLNGTARVLIEYNTRARPKGLLLEDVDVKNDRIGFVYAASAGDRDVYMPFKAASAYRR
jgi:hypothetical protein